MAVLLPFRGGTYYLWKYVPNVPAAAIVAVLWAAVTILLSWRMYKTRTWFCSAFIIGCFMELIGYCARAAASEKTDQLMPYVVQNIFILLPPALFAATIYMCLGRIIRLVGGEHLSVINPRILTKVFVGGDVFSFAIQSGSAGLTIMSTTNPTMGQIGQDMVLAGLAIQLVSFAIFGLTALIFHTRIYKAPTARSFQVDQAWIQSIYMLYGISILIIIRSIFRIIEYAMGEAGYLLTNEWTLYVFDTITMLAVAIIFYFRYPSNLTPKEDADVQLESQVVGETTPPAKY